MNPVVMNDEEVIRSFQRSEFIMRTVLLHFLLADVVSIKTMLCWMAHMMQQAKEAPPIMQLKATPNWLMMFMENSSIFSLLFLEVNKYSLPLVSEEEERNTRCLLCV